LNNKNVIESLNIFKGIETEKGLPLKFAYALGRNINALEPVVKALDKVRMAKIEGQQEYEDARKIVIELHAIKDDAGVLIQKPSPQGPEYDFLDRAALNVALEDVNKDHADAVAAIKNRVDEFTELLDDDVDYVPFKINIKYIPVDDAGNCKLSVMQLRYLIPFLDGEIDDIPDVVDSTIGTAKG
jgi:hypothetical protein